MGGGGVAANLPAVDMQWVESRAKKAALKLEKLDTDLKNSKVKISCTVTTTCPVLWMFLPLEILTSRLFQGPGVNGFIGEGNYCYSRMSI